MLDTSKLWRSLARRGRVSGARPRTTSPPTARTRRTAPVGLLERMTFPPPRSRTGSGTVTPPSWRAPRPRRAPASQWAPSRGGSTRAGTSAPTAASGDGRAPRDPDRVPRGSGPLRPHASSSASAPRGPGASLRHGAGPRSPGRERGAGQSVQRPRRCHRGEGPTVGLANLTALAPDLTGRPSSGARWSSERPRATLPAPYAVVTYATARPGVTLLVWRVFAALDPAYVAVLVPSRPPDQASSALASGRISSRSCACSRGVRLPAPPDGAPSP